MSHSNLRHAARSVLESWEKGDLSAAVRQLQEAYDGDTEAGGAPDEPALAIHMEGGLIHAIYANVADLKVLVIDYDTEGCDLEKLPTFPAPILSKYNPAAHGYGYTVVGPAAGGEKAEYRFETLIQGASYVEKLCEIAEQHDRFEDANDGKQPWEKLDQDLTEANVSAVPDDERAAIEMALAQTGSTA